MARMTNTVRSAAPGITWEKYPMMHVTVSIGYAGTARPASVWGMTPTMHGKTTNASIPKPRSADHAHKGGKKR